MLCIAHGSSTVNPACLKWPLVYVPSPQLLLYTIPKRYQSLVPGFPRTFASQFRLIKAFNSAKNSSIWLRSGEYGGKYTSFTPKAKLVLLLCLFSAKAIFIERVPFVLVGRVGVAHRHVKGVSGESRRIVFWRWEEGVGRMLTDDGIQWHIMVDNGRWW